MIEGTAGAKGKGEQSSDAEAETCCSYIGKGYGIDCKVGGMGRQMFLMSEGISWRMWQSGGTKAVGLKLKLDFSFAWGKVGERRERSQFLGRCEIVLRSAARSVSHDLKDKDVVQGGKNEGAVPSAHENDSPGLNEGKALRLLLQ